LPKGLFEKVQVCISGCESFARVRVCCSSKQGPIRRAKFTSVKTQLQVLKHRKTSLTRFILERKSDPLLSRVDLRKDEDQRDLTRFVIYLQV
jgi:hypothetical protein